MTSSVLRTPARLTEWFTTRIAPKVAFSVSARDRRTLLVGCTIVFATLLMFRGIPAWHAWVSAATTRAEATTQRLAFAQHQTAHATKLSATADSVASVYFALAPALLSGDSPAQASAALAAYMSEMAEAAGIRLGTVQFMNDSASAEASEIFRVRVRADGIGDVSGVTTFLRLIEGGGQPLLSVKTMSVSQAAPLATPDRAESLRISFVVEGVARRGGEP